ncbi:AraC family transcriptional regulator [Mesorhizobium sp. 1M-11]|uniref:helix-turn-helix domain-containing protein n=1 Tax=Mesorhizobium sp. 1M-11 TaxID=1529006 RepID=UPI0009EB03A3|nr:AraC family transcriptional regulator [Mesorhizobium sp. 1M-11]
MYRAFAKWCERQRLERKKGTAATLFGGERRHRLTLRRLNVTYAWLPPFEGASTTVPNRMEVVFSRHPSAMIEQAGKTLDVNVTAGGFYVVGPEPTTLLRVPEFSDTLEMYPDMDLLKAVAEENGQSDFVLRPTLGQEPNPHFVPDGTMLAVAHVLRQACLGQLTLSPIEASTLEHLLAAHAVGINTPWRGDGKLSETALNRVLDLIEDEIDQPLTLDRLADEARLSAFHFARSFKKSTGMAPYKYVLARRIEHAKRQLMTTERTVSEIAMSLGFENMHHFRRQFRSQLGILPGQLREVTGAPLRKT